MIKVNVEVDCKPWLKEIKNPKKYFNKKLKKISKIVSFFKGKNAIFTILLTNSLNMKKLNKKFRNRNKSTDVLSFPSFSPNNLKFSFQFYSLKNNLYFLYDCDPLNAKVREPKLYQILKENYFH